MKILALTGSIGMGKSTAAAMLRRMGLPVYCADAAVHALLAEGGAGVEAVAALHPPARKTGAGDRGFIDRKILGAAAFHDPALMRKLEALLHPLARREEKKFLKRTRARRRKLVILDIPLWFEGKRRCPADAVLVVSAPAFVQRARVRVRPGMTADKMQAILTRQMPDAEKRRRADVVIPTGLGRGHSWRKLKKMMRDFRD